MKFAIPLESGKLTPHFGHSSEFAFIEVKENRMLSREVLVPPPHEPGVLPQWLAEKNVSVVLAGGMGKRAIDLLAQNGIRVVTGAPVADPDSLVNGYLRNALETGENACSAGGGHECAGH